VFENFTDTFVGLGGTLEILVGVNLLSHFFTLQFKIASSAMSDGDHSGGYEAHSSQGWVRLG
jgi:hypothetical protein